jgi:hypothetical protein
MRQKAFNERSFELNSSNEGDVLPLLLPLILMPSSLPPSAILLLLSPVGSAQILAHAGIWKVRDTPYYNSVEHPARDREGSGNKRILGT